MNYSPRTSYKDGDELKKKHLSSEFSFDVIRSTFWGVSTHDNERMIVKKYFYKY